MIKSECNTWGSWPNGGQNQAEEEWLKIPEEQRMKFKDALKDTTPVIVGGIECKKSFQYIDDNILSGITDFSELEKLSAAYQLQATRYYPDLIPFLETRWTTSRLIWENHGQTEIDLSRTHLREIKMIASHLKILKLPKGIERVDFYNEILPEMELITQEGGNGVTVSVSLTGNVIPNFKNKNIKGLALLNADNLDLAVIPEYYPNLEWLRIVGKPGNVNNIASLAGLKKLKHFVGDDIFGFNGEDFPKPDSLIHLKSLWLESIPEEAGKYLKKIYKGKVDDLDIKKLRKEEWLSENLDNPLRGWDGSEFVPKTKAKKAAEIYRTSLKSAFAAANEFNTDRNREAFDIKIEAISKEYALLFNKLDKGSGFIETEEREDICEAFEILLNKTQATIKVEEYLLDREKLFNIIDEERDW